MEDDPYAPPAQSLQRYRKSCHWLKDDHFLKQLEKDTVDTDILDEEIHNVNESKPKTCRGKVLECLNSNPFQILLFVLVMVDAGIVVAEIFLDLRILKGECEQSMSMASEILQETYSEEFKGYPHFDSLVQVLDVLVSHYGEDLKMIHANTSHTDVIHPCQTYCETSVEHTSSHHERKRRDIHSNKHQLQNIAALSNTVQAERQKLEALRHKRSEAQMVSGSKEHDDLDQGHTESHLEGEGDHDNEEHHEGEGEHHDDHHSVGHILHLCSVAILSLFVIQLIVRIIAMGSKFCNEKLEVFDAVVICASFILDVVFIDGLGNSEGREAAVLLVVFLVWRLLRVINGFMVTETKRQEFRLKLQIRAREKVESKLHLMHLELNVQEKELETIKDLCRENEISEEEIKSCRPTKQQIKKNKSTALDMGLGHPLDAKKKKVPTATLR